MLSSEGGDLGLELSFDGRRKKAMDEVHLDGGLDEVVRVPQSLLRNPENLN